MIYFINIAGIKAENKTIASRIAYETIVHQKIIVFIFQNVKEKKKEEECGNKYDIEGGNIV